MKKSQYLDQLNPEQREAACALDGPVLIFAGAGSGKTRTLTYRLAYMIRECGVAPGEILAVTFTNKAADELKERIRHLVGEEAGQIWAGTFHWFCARLLRSAGEALGIPPNFTIYDEADQLSVVKRLLSGLNVDPDQTKPPAVLSEISRAKNQLLDPSRYKPRRRSPLEQTTAQVYRLYQEQLRRAGALDFDDLLMQAARLLEEDPEVRRRYQERFRYLLVDEYQDINFAQFRLLELLAGERRNLCVVGDDDQSIYGWRGADVGLILAFTQHFPEARTFYLERNYRSTRKILACANALITGNTLRAPKQLWTDNPPGDDVVLYTAVNEEEEAEWVAGAIHSMVRSGQASWGDFAVLYRANAMSRIFEEAFMALNLPYEVVGGVRFFDRAEIKDLIAYLQVVHNPADSIALRRILNNPPRGIGAQTLAVVDRLALTGELSLWDALAVALQQEELSPRALQALQAFRDLIEGLRDSASHLKLAELVKQTIQRSGYLARLRDSANADDARRAENVEEFVNVATRFVRRNPGADLGDFLEYVALVSDIDQAEELDSAVSLLTLHSAKGLEFPCVFVVGLEEGLLPHYRSQTEDGDLAEERRLLYVGMTRAQQRLWLSRAERRLQFGEVRQNPPSPFLKDLPLEGVRVLGRRATGGGPRLLDTVETGERAPELASTGRRLDLTQILSRAHARPSSAPDEDPGRAATAENASSPGEDAAPPAERVSAGKSASRRGASRRRTKSDEAPAVEFKTGSRVVHPKFGKGVVVAVEPAADTVTLVVAFPAQGVKKLDARYANLSPA